VTKPPPIAGLLLTGGTSVRLGQDKNVVLVEGERLVDRTAHLLEKVCGPVIEIGPGYSKFTAVREEPVGAGPLAAVAAGVGALRSTGFTGHALVLASDLWRLDLELLVWLSIYPSSRSVVPVVGGIDQTLCARYDEDALNTAVDLVAAGEHSMRSLLTAISAERVEIDQWGKIVGPECFTDLDTLEDLAALGDSSLPLTR